MQMCEGQHVDLGAWACIQKNAFKVKCLLWVEVQSDRKERGN